MESMSEMERSVYERSYISSLEQFLNDTSHPGPILSHLANDILYSMAGREDTAVRIRVLNIDFKISLFFPWL